MENNQEIIQDNTEVNIEINVTILQTWIKEFIEQKKLKPNSQRAYQVDLLYFTQFYTINKSSIQEINKQKILTWLSQYPQRVANRRGINIRQFILWLGKTNKVSINEDWYLSWKFTDPKPQKPNRAVLLEDIEINQLLNAKHIDLQKRSLIGLILSTAASLEEISRIQWKDFYLGNLSYINIGELGKERLIPLEENTISLINQLHYIVKPKDIDFVFCEKRFSKPINSAHLAMIIRRTINKILDKEISPTALKEFSKQRLMKRFPQIELTIELLGKKRATSLISMNEEKIDLVKLKRIHALAFSY